MQRLKITFLKQSGFFLEKNSSKLLIDPSNKESGNLKGDLVYVTHKHSDHTAGVGVFMISNPNAKLICNEQVSKGFEEFHERIIVVKPDEEVKESIWKLKFIRGHHGLFSGVINLGVIIKTESESFGHVGDSIEFQGFSNEELDFLAVPIGGIFTASPKKAIKEFISFKKPLPIIIPMHWLWRNPLGFCAKFQERFPHARCIVPENGHQLSY